MPALLPRHLLAPSRMNWPEGDSKVSSTELKPVDGQRAGLAQLLLVARLRARTRRDLAVDLLERAAQVIFVTCKNWFLPASRRDETVLPVDAVAPSVLPSDPNTKNNSNNKELDAHRHH